MNMKRKNYFDRSPCILGYKDLRDIPSPCLSFFSNDKDETLLDNLWQGHFLYLAERLVSLRESLYISVRRKNTSWQSKGTLPMPPPSKR